jgi:hypothetical protein
MFYFYGPIILSQVLNTNKKKLHLYVYGNYKGVHMTTLFYDIDDIK